MSRSRPLFKFGSKKDDQWDVSSLPPVNYISGITGCTASKCVEVDLKSVSLDSNATPPDDLLGSGPYRYNMTGYVGLKKPVEWGTCRFVISDPDGSNKEILSPADAETAGYAARQVWLYNPNQAGANGNGYTTCADNSPGGCKLLPFKGFHIELHGPTKNKTVKLLIPEA